MGGSNNNWFRDLFINEAKTALNSRQIIVLQSDEVLTDKNIVRALGYTPLDGRGGSEGQHAISDGDGGIDWTTIHSAEEVSY